MSSSRQIRTSASTHTCPAYRHSFSLVLRWQQCGRGVACLQPGMKSWGDQVNDIKSSPLCSDRFQVLPTETLRSLESFWEIFLSLTMSPLFPISDVILGDASRMFCLAHSFFMDSLTLGTRQLLVSVSSKLSTRTSGITLWEKTGSPPKKLSVLFMTWG